MRATPVREIKMSRVSRQVQNLHYTGSNNRMHVNVIGERRFSIALAKVVN